MAGDSVWARRDRTRSVSRSAGGRRMGAEAKLSRFRSRCAWQSGNRRKLNQPLASERTAMFGSGDSLAHGFITSVHSFVGYASGGVRFNWWRPDGSKRIRRPGWKWIARRRRDILQHGRRERSRRHECCDGWRKRGDGWHDLRDGWELVCTGGLGGEVPDRGRRRKRGWYHRRCRTRGLRWSCRRRLRRHRWRVHAARKLRQSLRHRVR